MRVVIMGSGRTGKRLADRLLSTGHDVTLIDWSSRAFDGLPDDFSGETVLGNGLDQDILRQAGIESADVFVAATAGDNRNIMAAQIVQHVFAVSRVITRIKDPIRADFYRSRGIEVDCRTTAGADAVLHLVDEWALEHTAQ